MTDLNSYADPLKAVCAFLRVKVGGVLSQTPTGLKGIPAGVPAVFRPDLPEQIAPVMPLECVVVRPAGGYTQYGKEMFYVADPRFDFVCFGSSQSRATRVATAVATELKQLSSPQTWEGAQLYSAQVHGGPVPLPDEQTLWPACWLQAVVMHGELPAPAL